MTEQTITVRTDGHLLRIGICRPPLNFLRSGEVAALRAAFRGIAGNVRAVTLEAEGRHFCAGSDVEEFTALKSPDEIVAHLQAGREAFWSILECPVPVVAGVQGAAAGTGALLAACCDAVVAADDARFSLPEIRAGVLGGIDLLSRWLPASLARRMAFSAQPVTAAALQPLGVLAAVVARDALPQATASFAAGIAEASRAALVATKAAAMQGEIARLKAAYAEEHRICAELMQHADSKEALAAAIGRRQPAFSA